MTKNKAEKPLTLPWEICAKDHGADVTEYCNDVDEVLDLCGRLLYANAIFTMTLLRISHAYSEGNWEGWVSPERGSKTYVWIMKCVRKGKVQEPRFFDHRHDLFGMMIAELQQGTDHIEISKDH